VRNPTATPTPNPSPQGGGEQAGICGSKMILARFILRFLLVPLGIVAAAVVGIVVIMVGEWNAFVAFMTAHPDDSGYMIGAMMFAPILLMTLGGGALAMLAPGSIGILVAEFFAIRSWIFHVANGALSAWVGWKMFEGPSGAAKLFQDPKLIVVMGIMAGITYWVIAGWSAGFWKPVFAQNLPPPAQPLPSATEKV
jgi:hypothetical protein